jgi:hypothetical protein
MANNRLYLLDTETGEKIMIAKAFGPPWDIRITLEQLAEFLDGRDIQACCNSDVPTSLKLVTERDVDDPFQTVDFPTADRR